MHKIWVLHGPNLNLLGIREKAHYGGSTLATIDAELNELAKTHKIDLESFQYNSESALIEKIHHSLTEKVNYLIVNPAAFTHTSIALRDALLAVKIPFIEVHLSNIAARETFRQQSYFSDIATGIISGFGKDSYMLAMQAAINALKQQV